MLSEELDRLASSIEDAAVLSWSQVAIITTRLRSAADDARALEAHVVPEAARAEAQLVEMLDRDTQALIELFGSPPNVVSLWAYRAARADAGPAPGGGGAA